MSIINLLPDDYIERRSQRRANVMCMGLFAIVITAVLAAAMVSEQSSRHTRDVRNRIDASYAEAAKVIAQMQQMEAQRTQMLHKAELTASLVERVPRSVLLAVVTNALPRNCSLLNVSLETSRIVRASRPPGGKTTRLTNESKWKAKPLKTRVQMEVTGRAGTDVDVARFIANLARNPLMRSVDLVYSEEKLVNKVSIRKFQVRMELRGGADAIDVLGRPEQAGTRRVEAIRQALQGRQT